jgi:hypothetical protein
MDCGKAGDGEEKLISGLKIRGTWLGGRSGVATGVTHWACGGTEEPSCSRM